MSRVPQLDAEHADCQDVPSPRRLVRSSAPLDRTRMITLASSTAVLLAHAVPILIADVTRPWKIAALAALGLLLALLGATAFRRRPVLLEPVLTPALIAVAAAPLSGPVRTMTLIFAVSAFFALYGSTGSWIVRMVAGLAVLPASAGLAGLSGHPELTWHTPEVLSLTPLTVPVNLVMRNIHHVLVQQARVSGRDAMLSSAGARILAAADIDDLHRIGTELSVRMAELTPGTVMVVVRREPDGLRIARSVGMPIQLSGRRVDQRVLDDPATEFRELAPRLRHWHVEQTADRFLLLGSARPVPPDAVDAFRNLVHQIVLGESGLKSRDELQYRAHHDYLTRLANRDLFFRTLVDAAENGRPGSVALLSVDLDDFKKVNDTYGHTAGDELLIEVAHRLRAAAGTGGLAARFGGDEFGVLLTGLSGEPEAEEAALALRDRLIAPVDVTGATVRVGASIGIASTSSALTATELVRRADLAMYAAKASGKNRVERYELSESRVPAGRSGPGSSAPAW